MLRFLLAALLLSVMVARAPGQTAWPVAASADWRQVTQHVQQLRAALERAQAPWPQTVDRELVRLIEGKGSDRSLARIQDLLDSVCLVGVSINPESRVKATRGPCQAELSLGKARVVLVKIHNEAGITHRLAVTSDEIREGASSNQGRWLQATLLNRKPLAETLSGAILEYVPLQLVGHEAGKREATLKFDAGQGTQDLGFRAEVPILFRIASR